jgi:hypothetical protein
VRLVFVLDAASQTIGTGNNVLYASRGKRSLSHNLYKTVYVRYAERPTSLSGGTGTPVVLVSAALCMLFSKRNVPKYKPLVSGAARRS